jgi:hypothetical protein
MIEQGGWDRYVAHTVEEKSICKIMVSNLMRRHPLDDLGIDER